MEPDKTEVTPVVNLTEIETEMAELRKVVAELSVPGNISEPEPQQFADMRDYLLTLHAASRGDGAAQAKIAEFALAGDTTTGAAGLVPDFQKSEIISVITDVRPYINTLPSTDIGDSGMTLDYPLVTQKPVVEEQAVENTEVGSQSFTVGTDSFDIVTFAGANLASRQVVERSAPSYVEAFYAEMAGQYAEVSEAATIAAGVAGAGGTAILADLSADAAATWAAVSLAATTIAAAVKRPASHMALGATRWAQLMSLADSDGRPLIVFPENGPSNAQGLGGLNSMAGQYGGLTAYFAPEAVATDCLIYAASRFHDYAEQNPVQLRAEVVSTLSWELGVYGLAVPDIVKYGDGGYTLTAA